MIRRHLSHSFALAGTTVLAVAALLGTAHAGPKAATGVDSVDFAAAHHPTYNHATGGGFYGDGSNAFVREELESTNFKCGDTVSYLLKFEGTGAGESVTTSWEVDFDYATTGQAGVALVPLVDATHVLLNVGDSQYSDGGEQAQLLARTATLMEENSGAPVVLFDSGITRVGFQVAGVDPGDFLVVRLDAVIVCQFPSSPTGNLLVKAASGHIGADKINLGEQTVPLKVRDDFTQQPPT